MWEKIRQIVMGTPSNSDLGYKIRELVVSTTIKNNTDSDYDEQGDIVEF
jgi:hypothetical protein